MTDKSLLKQALETIQSELTEGHLDSASTEIDAQLKHYPDDPNLAYLRALHYRLTGDSESALKVLSALTGSFPNMARAHQEVALNSVNVAKATGSLVYSIIDRNVPIK